MLRLLYCQGIYGLASKKRALYDLRVSLENLARFFQFQIHWIGENDFSYFMGYILKTVYTVFSVIMSSDITRISVIGRQNFIEVLFRIDHIFVHFEPFSFVSTSKSIITRSSLIFFDHFFMIFKFIQGIYNHNRYSRIVHPRRPHSGPGCSWIVRKRRKIKVSEL